MFLGSNIIIDATRQHPGEGGTAMHTENNRPALIEKAPVFLR